MTNPVVTSQLGWLGLGALLMLFTNGDRGTGARGGATEETEALLFTTP